MSGVYYQTVVAEEVGQRLDNYLIRVLRGVPRSHIYRLIRAGEVRVNKKRARPCSRLAMDDVIRIPPVRCAAENKAAFVGVGAKAALLASIIYEDAALIVLNKPTGIAVHGGSGLSFGVIEALRIIRPELAYLELVHRLDKETSGCLLIAKKRSALRAIQAAFNAHQVTKQYWALLAGRWQGAVACTVNAPLQKNTLQSGERMVCIHPEGKASQTAYRLRENFSTACWVDVTPATGRTHQIRVHSASMGHAVLGDLKYGTPENDRLPQRLYLHARAIRFTLNETDYRFEAEVDAKFTQALCVLRAVEESKE